MGFIVNIGRIFFFFPFLSWTECSLIYHENLYLHVQMKCQNEKFYMHLQETTTGKEVMMKLWEIVDW